MPNKPALKVVQDAADPIPTEILATHIRDISAGISRLRKGPNTLTDRALFLLIQDAAPVKIGLREIGAVFTAIDSLQRRYVRGTPGARS